MLVLLAVLASPRFAAAQDDFDGEVRLALLDSQTERAIERGIQYLAQHQQRDGSWVNGEFPVACTSVGLMAFMLKGHFPNKGSHGDRLNKAVAFLLNQSKVAGGYMGKNMYEHGLATLALSEAWGMSPNADVRTALKRAVEVILTSQNRAGGWRYTPHPTSGDVSVTVMQVVALRSASEAGIFVPAETMNKAVAFVKDLQVKPEGGFGYVKATSPAFARSAAGTMALMISGRRDTPEIRMGLQYLRRQPDSIFDTATHYYYGHYYAVQAMYQAGDSYFQEWYPKIKRSLLKQQRPDGSFVGPVGPSFCTSVSILILGVPYRYLPIYQR